MFRLHIGRSAIVPLIAVVALAIAACSDPEPSPTPVSTTPPAATSIPISPTAEPIATPVVGSGIENGDPEFDFSAMVSQGYWLSRDHFGPFVMASGMGIPFKPSMDQLQMAMQMVAQNPDDVIVIPQNMAPLQAVFASASPNLINDPREFGAMDFEVLRLDSSTFDQRVTVRGQAQTMLKESQWAHTFATGHFGSPEDDFGAQQRFMGIMVAMLAQMQGQYAMQNLMGLDGLYHDSDGDLDYVGNWVLLHAFADIAGLTGEEGGRYTNSESHPMFEQAAGGLFKALEGRDPASPQEAAAAIRALAFFASTTRADEDRDNAVARSTAIGEGTLASTEYQDVVDLAAAIVGLIASAEIADQESHHDAADGLFEVLLADFDRTHGVFKSKSVSPVHGSGQAPGSW